MADLTSDSFRPYIGLSSIELSSGLEDGVPLLPEDSGLDPIDAAVEARLAAILEAKNFDRVMLDAIRPNVEDHSILKPGRFYSIRREILEKLRQVLQSENGSEAQEELNALAKLLEKLAADHDLGEHYRFALLKG